MSTTAITKQGQAVTTTEQFGEIQKRPSGETAAIAMAAQAKAAVQARYIMAMEKPRDMDVVRQKILKECNRPSFAESAMYKKPVAGTTVTGLSIRFAEAALRAMTNILPEAQMIYDDADKRVIRVMVTDLESNVTYSKDLLIEKTVERKSLKKGQQPISSRINSQGERTYLVAATEDDMATKEAALTSKALRQNGLRLLPGDIQDECIDQIKATLKAKDAQDPDAAKNKIIDGFDDLGIRVNDLKQFLGVENLDKLTPKDMITLRGIYQAIRDGEANWQDVMDQRENARGPAKPAAAAGEPAPVGTRTQEVLRDVKANTVDPAEQARVAQAKLDEERRTAPIEKDPAAVKPMEPISSGLPLDFGKGS